MKLKIILSATMLAMASLTASAQTTIQGTVADSISHEGEPYVTIRVYKKGQEAKPAAMFVTDLNGRFSHRVDATGNYFISFRSMGRQPIIRPIHLAKSGTLDLDTLYIQDDANMLGNVEIVAQKPLVKMETDKMSYDVQADADSKTVTVLDMLRKVPMVTVDGQDNITVNGSGSFKVYVDGRPNVMFSANPSQIFKSMPASMVKNIEVVTNPGAKYDAEGAGGVLNIVMNKMSTQSTASMNGYNGSLSAEVGNKSERVSGFLSGQQGKLTYSANAMYNYGHTDGTELSMSRRSSDGSTMDYYQKGDSKVPFSMANVSLGLDVDTMSNIAATIGFTNFTLKTTGHPTTTFGGGLHGNGFSYSNAMTMENRNTGFNGSLSYQRYLNRSRSSNITLTYLLSLTPGETRNTTDYDPIESISAGQGSLRLNDLYSDAKTHATEHTFLADYTATLVQGMTLSAGAKYINRNNHSDSKYYNIINGNEQYNEENSVDYKNHQNILAGYAEYALNAGNFGMKAGLRYEYTWEDVTYRVGRGDDFSRNYGNLVPTASMTLKLRPTMNIGLSYNMRITRPGISYLNPYVDRSNPTQVSYGNPDLDVQKTHNLSLVFNSFSSKLMLNATLSQSFTGNEMAQYSFLGTDGLLNTTYGNIIKSRRTALNIFANYAITPKTRLMLNGSVSYADLRSEVLNAHNHGWTANGYLGLQQTLPWDFKASVFAMASTKRYTLQGYNSGMNMVNVSLAKSFCKDKFSLAARFMTPLTGKMKMTMYSRGADFTQATTVKVPLMNAALTFTWNFGNTRRHFSQKQRRQQTNDFEERQSQGQQIMQMGSGNITDMQQR